MNIKKKQIVYCENVIYTTYVSQSKTNAIINLEG